MAVLLHRYHHEDPTLAMILSNMIRSACKKCPNLPINRSVRPISRKCCYPLASMSTPHSLDHRESADTTRPLALPLLAEML